jgi:hypothetical protein
MHVFWRIRSETAQVVVGDEFGRNSSRRERVTWVSHEMLFMNILAILSSFTTLQNSRELSRGVPSLTSKPDLRSETQNGHDGVTRARLPRGSNGCGDPGGQSL